MDLELVEWAVVDLEDMEVVISCELCKNKEINKDNSTWTEE